MESSHKTRLILAGLATTLLVIIGAGLFWFFTATFTMQDAEAAGVTVGIGWYLFSFAAGLTMIILPCTLPLAFVIVPLSMGKGIAKGLGIAVSFGLGVALTLSVYGVVAAALGQVAIGAIGAPLENVKNWFYFSAGIFAYLFALGEIGLLRWRMPSYTGAAPAFIQRQGDYAKALLLGLFLGNIGVGCPHPATPVILTRIAISGDVFYGWLLFFTHAVGRVLPLLLLALLAILGVNALQWLVARKDKIERATGWGMIYVGAFILVLGLFTHDWWVNSGQHTLLEEITREEFILDIVAEKLNTAAPHTHAPERGEGLFGFPLWLGNWMLILLWVLPLWWYFLRKQKEARLPDVAADANRCEARVLSWRFWFSTILTLLLGITFIWVLPDRFLNHTPHRESSMMMDAGDMHGVAEGNGHGVSLSHEEVNTTQGIAVNLNIIPTPIAVGSTTRLDFFVNQKPGNIPIDARLLEIEHTKMMHVIGVRDDLGELFHIHPAPTTTQGILSVDYIFQAPGRYKIWSEIKKDGVVHSFGHPEFRVEGAGIPYAKNVSFQRSVKAGGYEVSLEHISPIGKKWQVELVFDVHDAAGQKVALEPYLGAFMHLPIIKDDWKVFIHNHPANDMPSDLHQMNTSLFMPSAFANGAHTASDDDEHGVVFLTAFPEAGLYRAFAQFRPKGIALPPDESLVAPFWIRVEEEGPRWAPTRLMLTFASLILIALLSVAVKKYITVSVGRHE